MKKDITIEELKQSLLRGAVCDAFRKNVNTSGKAHEEINIFNFPFQDFKPVANTYWTEQALMSLKQTMGYVLKSSLDDVFKFEEKLLCAERDIRKTYPTDKIEWNDIEENVIFKSIDLGDGVSMVYFVSGENTYIAYLWHNETLHYVMKQYQYVFDYRNQSNN